MALAAFGWRPEMEAALGDPALSPQRVVTVDRRGVRTTDGDREMGAVVPGKLRHRAATRDLPAVGDWVAVREVGGRATIEAVLPRKSVLTRRDPDQRSEQVLVANVDLAILVMGLDGDYNLRRLERYLTLVGAAGVAPLVVLSKADLADDAAEKRARVEEAAPGVPALAVNLIAGGHRAVEPYLEAGETAVLLGSSGAGKSTLINALLGDEVQRTSDVRAHDSRGRHTTTIRQLFLLPGGALVIDTPGLREIELVSDTGLDEAFPELAALAERCRFRDCRHTDEPGCALMEAEADGHISSERLAAFRKLAAELARPARGARRRR